MSIEITLPQIDSDSTDECVQKFFRNAFQQQKYAQNWRKDEPKFGVRELGSLLYDFLSSRSGSVSVSKPLPKSKSKYRYYEDSSHILCYRGMRTDLGTGIEIRYYPEWGNVRHFEADVIVRGQNGKYGAVLSKDCPLEAIKEALGMRGAPPKKTKRTNKGIAERFKWHTFPRAQFKHEDNGVVCNNQLKAAWCFGFCRVDPDTANVHSDVADPDTEEHLYFYVKVMDYSGRDFFVLLRADADEFMVAMNRGSVIKLTADDKLFATGNDPLFLKDMTKGDQDLIKTAIGTLA